MGDSRRRLRVLTMIDGVGIAGGGEVMARQIAMHLDPARFTVAFCATRWSPEPEQEALVAELRDAGVAFHGMKRSACYDLRPWRQLISKSRQERIDVLHTHKFGSNAWGALLYTLLGARVFVAHEHTWSYEGNPRRVFIDRQLIGWRADAIVAVSREDQRRMVEIERIPSEKIRFIANGIPALRPPRSGRNIRAELGIRTDQPIIGTVATLRPQKALDVLIKAFSLVVEQVPGAVMLIVGGEDPRGRPESERLHQLAMQLGLGDRVKLLGERTDVPDLVAAFDVAALSSDFEGSPLSVLEYMDAGKPVVATRVGGLPDLIEDGVNGFLVEAQNPPALAEALESLLSTPARAARMGAAGRRRRREEFSIEATARQVGELYEELHATKAGG